MQEYGLKKIFNVLVFPGGTEIGLEIWKALSKCKEVRLFSVGSRVSNHAPYIFANYEVIPSVHEPDWLPALNQYIGEHDIDYIFPAHDDVVVALAQNNNKIPARVISSPLRSCLICRSKSQTYRFFEDVIPVPVIHECYDAIMEYPVFVKPDKGQGSQQTHVVNNKEQLIQLLGDNKDLIITEYLPGEEYTVDCFSDRDIGLLFCEGRQRIRTRGGISMNSHMVENPVFVKYARTIFEKLRLNGGWFYQVKKDRNGTLKLMEIAPRIAGTMALHRVQGVNFPLLSIYEQERVPFEIMVNPLDIEIDRALVNRYKHQLQYNAVYVDLDDTLILRDRVNLNLIRFLFQCINQGIRIVLLTKHTAEVEQTLEQYRLKGLFDEIIHLEPSADKANYIREAEAIFIDDSFSERKAVHNKLSIMTFDSSMLEMLFDERS